MKYIFNAKIKLFVPAKFDQEPDPQWLGPWIRIWIHIEVKSWIRIRIRIEAHADPVAIHNNGRKFL